MSLAATTAGMKIVHTRNHVKLISLMFVLSCPTSACIASGKGKFWFSMIASQKDGRKSGNLTLESCSQILEENEKNSVFRPVYSYKISKTGVPIVASR